MWRDAASLRHVREAVDDFVKEAPHRAVLDSNQ